MDTIFPSINNFYQDTDTSTDSSTDTDSTGFAAPFFITPFQQPIHRTIGYWSEPTQESEYYQLDQNMDNIESEYTALPSVALIKSRSVVPSDLVPKMSTTVTPSMPISTISLGALPPVIQNIFIGGLRAELAPMETTLNNTLTLLNSVRNDHRSNDRQRAEINATYQQIAELRGELARFKTQHDDLLDTLLISADEAAYDRLLQAANGKSQEISQLYSSVVDLVSSIYKQENNLILDMIYDAQRKIRAINEMDALTRLS